MQTPTFRRSAPAVLVLAALAIVVGCGGGGGGGGSSSNGTTSTTSTPSTTGTPSTTSTTSTPVAFTTSGALLSDTIYYSNRNTGETTINYDVRSINPNGTGGTTYASFPNGDVPAVAADPSAPGRVVFAAAASGSSVYGIYRNTSLTTVGAEVLVAPTYSYVSTIQPSPDGSRVLYVASTGENPTRVYSLTIAGKALANIDEGNFASLSYDGTKVVYEKTLTDTNSEIYLRVLGSGSSTRLTNNAVDDLEPQFSKDGTKVVFAEDVAGDVGRRIIAIQDLSTLAITTVEPLSGGSHEFPSFNGPGDRLSFVGYSADASGLYVTGVGFTNPALIVANNGGTDTFVLGTYWTGFQGRSTGLPTLGINFTRRK